MERFDDWFVVMTKPRMEKNALENLVRQGFQAYLPYWATVKKRNGTLKPAALPMFPRYLFVRQSYSGQSTNPIRSTYGVSQLVRFGYEPARASEELIDSIRLLEKKHEQASSAVTPFKAGDLVRVVEGAFQGISAEVLSCDQQRVILLLQILGKTQSLEFKASVCSVI